ncbi:MAG TPA: GIY-YIG nuclease family protein, partial [Methylomirabilota bacterium]|nr:GIY-YIG nuclease family protein [Methylomirabilota bacterium]
MKPNFFNFSKVESKLEKIWFRPRASSPAIRLAPLAHGYSLLIGKSYLIIRPVEFVGVECPELVEGPFSRLSANSTHMPFFVYILRSTTNELYIGQTNNLEGRE